MNNEKEKMIFFKEREIISRARAILEQEEGEGRTASEWKKEFLWLSDCFEKLLKDMKKITRIGDVNYKKLMSAKEQIHIQKNELEVLNQELTEANAAKDRIYSIIAHDLKNPLHFLLFASDMVGNESGKIENKAVRRFVEKVFKTAQSMYELLENLLEWSRSQHGEIECRPLLFDLHTIVKEVIEYFEYHSESKSIQLVSSIPQGTLVYADANMIRPVLRNLVSNAIKYSYPGGEVRIECREEGRWTEVSVTDSGIGIPLEKQGALFKIGETFSTVGTRKESGSGFGLLLCNEFVRKNHGQIRVTSTPGQGSCFLFTLPRSQVC